MKAIELNILIEKEKSSAAGYSGYCPALPGCFSNGGTADEARQNLQEAIAAYIHFLSENGQILPISEPTLRVEKLSFVLPR
jgi:predicted RNase H-like HicB family nuclease